MMPMTNEVLAMGMRFRRLGHGEQQVCGAIAVERVSGTCGTQRPPAAQSPSCQPSAEHLVG